MQAVADTGLLKALLDRNDAYHKWAGEIFPQHVPWITCEAVLAEASHLSRAPQKVMQLVAHGDVQVHFAAELEAERLVALLGKYQDYGMDLADACLVRMTELEDTAVIFTLDREDFTVYRKHGNQPVPCVFPAQVR
jgi:predicted nucleic acid-binding protein